MAGEWGCQQRAKVAKSFSQLNDLLGKAQHLYAIHGLAGKPNPRLDQHHISVLPMPCLLEQVAQCQHLCMAFG